VDPLEAWRSHLGILDLKSGQLRLLVGGPGLNNYGHWSRDGRWIVFQSNRHAAPRIDSLPLRDRFRSLEIYIVRPDGSDLRQLTTNEYYDGHPSGSTAMALRALIIWFALLVVAVANGGFRERVLIPRFGPHAGHIVSTIMFCAGILIVTYVAVAWIHPGSRRDTIAIGLAWLALTLAFEFGFGRARGKPWAELLADYDVLKGRTGCSCS